MSLFGGIEAFVEYLERIEQQMESRMIEKLRFLFLWLERIYIVCYEI